MSGAVSGAPICQNRDPEKAPQACDEYPFYSTKEGGRGASLRLVPKAEQDLQGGLIGGFGGFYTQCDIDDNDSYAVIPLVAGTVPPGTPTFWRCDT